MDGERGGESHVVCVQGVHFVLSSPALLVRCLLVRGQNGIVGMSAAFGLGKRVLGGRGKGNKIIHFSTYSISAYPQSLVTELLLAERSVMKRSLCIHNHRHFVQGLVATTRAELQTSVGGSPADEGRG